MSKKIYCNNGKSTMFSDEMNKIINNVDSDDKLLLIDSTAGTGKTTTICSIVGYLMDYCNVKSYEIMIVTYTKNTSQNMKFKLKQYTYDEFILLGTMHHIAYQFIKNDDINDKDYNNDENNYYSPCEILANYNRMIDLLVKNKKEKITNKNPLNDILKNIKYLFVDEYQDFDASQINIINSIHQLSNCNVLFFGDIDQSIYQFRNSINSLDNDFLKKFKKFHLKHNHRNSEKIINLANRLLKYKYFTLQNINYNDENAKQIIQANFFNDESSTIKIIGTNSLNDEIDHLMNYLKTIDYTNKKILVLSRYRFPLTILENMFIKNNIEYNNLDDLKFIKNGKISISTIHGAKGLEADEVILINAGNIDIVGEESQQLMVEEINLLYVAVTRCKENLLITYHYKIHKILEHVLDKSDNHILPLQIIKPVTYPKNNYVSFGVTECVKRLGLKDYEKIKSQYKITSVKKQVHPSLKELTGKTFLDIISFLNDKMSGTLPIMGNYIDHYIGYIIGNKKSSYHPDLQHIKLIDYIGKNNDIYRFLYALDKNVDNFVLDISKQPLNIDELKTKYEDVYKFTKMTNKKFESMISVFQNIVDKEFGKNLLDFIQLNPLKMNLSQKIKSYLSFNDKTINNDDINVVYKTIFINSLLTSIIRGKTSYEYLLPQIKKSMFECTDELKWFNEIEKYITKSKYDIYQKSMHGFTMNGIIDLYSSETKTITDIKCSYTKFVPSQYIVQLLYYYILGMETGLDVSNEHKLYFPIFGTEITYKFEYLPQSKIIEINTQKNINDDNL
jgi:hypothetical protein